MAAAGGRPLRQPRYGALCREGRRGGPWWRWTFVATAAWLAPWAADRSFAAGPAREPSARRRLRDDARVVMRGKNVGPMRQHRPNGAPFATSADQLVRRPMFLEEGVFDPIQERHVEALASEDLEVRRAGALELWRFEGQATAATKEALLVALLDPDWKVRWDAALTLGKLGLADRWNTDPYIARVAAKLRSNTTEADAKVCFAEAIGRIGTPAHPYSRAVGDNLEHPDWRVRLACAEALGKMGPEQHFHRATLVRLMRDDNEAVRAAADHTLRKKPYEKPGWMKVQNPGWRKRVLKAVRNKSRR